MHKLRANYSFLSTWASGDWNRAIEGYFKLKTFTTPQMEMGKKFHKEWEEEVKKTQKLPFVFDSKPLKNPLTEIYGVVELADWLLLSGVVDCYDEGTGIIYEYKTGKQSSESYANTRQPSIYALLLTESGHTPKKVEIHHYDQYKKQSDMSIVWVTPQLIADGLEWVTSLGAEAHNYFVENSLYEKYGHLK
jgi:hypothetical protein